MTFTKTDLNQNFKLSGKKVLMHLPSGIKTTPAWLFKEFTSSSLAKHGIRRVSSGMRTLNQDQEQVEYVIQQTSSDSVRRISADTPISYQGWGRWS